MIQDNSKRDTALLKEFQKFNEYTSGLRNHKTRVHDVIRNDLRLMLLLAYGRTVAG